MNKRNYIVFPVLVATAALSFGCNKGDSTESTPSTTPATSTKTDEGGGAASSTTAGGRGGIGIGRPGMGGPMGGGMAGGMGGAPGAPGASGAAATGKTPVTKVPAISVAQDPFKPAWHKEPLPPYVFSEVQPIRLASAAVATPLPNNTTIKEFPTRRVSGIMSGDGIYAILEGGFEPEIVKPGSQTRDGYRVVSITSNSVKLQRKFGNVILEQTVPLTDVPAGVQTTGFRGGAPGMGGMPGMGGAPGAGGVPGMGGRPGGGKGGGGDAEN